MLERCWSAVIMINGQVTDCGLPKGGTFPKKYNSLAIAVRLFFLYNIDRKQSEKARTADGK